MVVKKFEARSMKEALEMVKSEMGPEAIIIAARDNSKRYGLVGEDSVEITAAIQELSLQKKQYAESRIPADIREKLHRSSSKVHRELIEKSVQRREAQTSSSSVSTPSAAASSSKPTKVKNPTERTQRYIDMRDDVEPEAAPNGTNEKLKMAAQKAWKSIQQSHSTTSMPVSPSIPTTTDSSMKDIKNELDSLKQIFQSFHQVPQNIVQGHPGSEHGLRYELAESYEKLCRVGIAPSIVIDLLKSVQEKLPHQKMNTKNSPLIQGLIAQALAQKLEFAPPTTSNKVEVFMGAGGHGKTSTLVKRAANLVLNEHKKVAILSTDTQKFGANEPLKIYAQILNIPFMPIYHSNDWETVSHEIHGFDSILVDSPGVRFRVANEMQQLKQLLPPSSLGVTVHLVLSATSKDQDAIELGKRFASIGFDDIIFTALDESFQHGVLVNFQSFIGKPFHSFGIGPQVPEDYELATKERVIDLLIGSTAENIQASLNMNL